MDKRKAVRRGVADGLSDTEIAARVGVSHQYVGQLAREMGLPSGASRMTARERAVRKAMEPMIAEGKTLGEIAQGLGLKVEQVSYRVRKRKLPTPRNARALDAAGWARCRDAFARTRTNIEQAAMLGVCVATVVRWNRALGLRRQKSQNKSA